MNLRDEEDGPPNVLPRGSHIRLIDQARAFREEAAERAEVARQADRLVVERYADKQARRFWERSRLGALWAWLRGES